MKVFVGGWVNALAALVVTPHFSMLNVVNDSFEKTSKHTNKNNYIHSQVCDLNLMIQHIFT